MWLLSTDRAELHYFARSFDAVGGYATLSHTWDGDEQSLQQVRAIAERCRANGTTPRDDPELSPKIRECCILAERRGYRWVWIDSCCIDKTSSSELSEAVNSMYKWYKSAEACFAYLKDVPRASADVVGAPGSAFRKSRWHTRGWTLQELIAPDSVVFLSADWRELGNRAELALLLQEITGVPSEVLLGAVRPAQYSAGVRMSWAAGRRTTRVEDEAYCLMGLFGISMPTNYGEGKRAFARLQYEIMQHKECDTSLFAFGRCISRDDIVREGVTFCTDEIAVDRGNPWRYLLADSPRHFRNTYEYIPDFGSNPPPDSTTDPFDHAELPHATATSYGVQFRLPVATVNGITIAVMLCQRNGRHCGLFLTRDLTGKDPQRPRYFVGRGYYTGLATGSAGYLSRMCDLGEDLRNLSFNGQRVDAAWLTIYIVPTPSDLDSERTACPSLLINCDPASRFHLPRWLVDQFTTLQFEVDQLRNTRELHVVRFAHRSDCRIFVSLGSCREHRDADDRPQVLWARVDVMPLLSPEEFTHSCPEDHIDSNPKTFGDADRKVRLSFMPSRMTAGPETTLIIHLELFGRIFEKMRKEAGISFPLLADLERNAAPTPAGDARVTVASSQPQSASQITPTTSGSPLPPVAKTLDKWFPRIPRARNRPVPKRSLDTPSTPSPVLKRRRISVDAPIRTADPPPIPLLDPDMPVDTPRTISDSPAASFPQYVSAYLTSLSCHDETTHFSQSVPSSSSTFDFFESFKPLLDAQPESLESLDPILLLEAHIEPRETITIREYGMSAELGMFVGSPSTQVWFDENPSE